MRLVIAAFTLAATLLGPAVAAATIHDRDAVHCEFYVDGVGRGHTYYTWYFRDWLDVYLRWDRSTFAAQGDSVIGAGFYTRYEETRLAADGSALERATREELVPGRLVETAPTADLHLVSFTLAEAVTTLDSARLNETLERHVDQLAFFIDVRRKDGSRDRLWLKNGSRDFTLAEIFDSYATVSQPLGRGQIEYVKQESGSPVFAALHACRR